MKSLKLKFDIDRDADAGYISLPRTSNEAILNQIMIEDSRLSGYVVLDVDNSGKVVGIEFIGVSSLINS